MSVLDAALLIMIVAWLLDIVPGWAVFIPFGVMVVADMWKESGDAER